MAVAHKRLALCWCAAMTEDEHLVRFHSAMSFVEGKTVADIACGTSYGTKLLAWAGTKSVFGMDLSKEAVATSQESCNATSVSYSVANTQRLTVNFQAMFMKIL